MVTFARSFGVLLLALITLTGCASTGYEKAAQTSTSLEKAARSIEQGNAQLDAVMAALSDLVNNPGSDLRKQYKLYVSEVDKLQSIATTVRKQADDIQKGGAEYLAKWDEELALIQNEAIRTRSEERRQQVSGQLMQIDAGFQQARNDFAPFMTDITDIRTALGADLTLSGLESVRDIVNEANREIVPLRNSLNRLANEFKQMGVLLSPQPAQ